MEYLWDIFMSWSFLETNTTTILCIVQNEGVIGIKIPLYKEIIEITRNKSLHCILETSVPENCWAVYLTDVIIETILKQKCWIYWHISCKLTHFLRQPRLQQILSELVELWYHFS